jgi:hypothetical protein
MRLPVQLIASGALVAGVLWWMWRLPVRGERWFGLAPLLALGSAWVGLASVVVSVGLWWVALPDGWLVVVFLWLDPCSIALGVLVLWIYRDYQTDQTTTVIRQRQQAWAGIWLGLIAVAIGYTFVMTSKSLFTPVGM